MRRVLIGERPLQDRPRLVNSILETLAVVGPIICLVDCIVIPIVLAVLPFIGAAGFQKVWHGVGDQLLALLVFLICTPVIIPGYIQHRKLSVILFMVAGFTFIFLANFVGTAFDESVHSILTIMGSCFLVKANWDNKRFRQTCCHCDCSGSSTVVIESSTKKQ